MKFLNLELLSKFSKTTPTLKPCPKEIPFPNKKFKAFIYLSRYITDLRIIHGATKKIDSQCNRISET